MASTYLDPEIRSIDMCLELVGKWGYEGVAEQWYQRGGVVVSKIVGVDLQFGFVTD